MGVLSVVPPVGRRHTIRVCPQGGAIQLGANPDWLPLPGSATCFAELYMLSYPTAAVLISKLEMALDEQRNFDFA